MNITFIYNDIQIYPDRTYEQSSNKDGTDAQTIGQGYKKRGHQVAEGCRKTRRKEEIDYFRPLTPLWLESNVGLGTGCVYCLSVGQPRGEEKNSFSLLFWHYKHKSYFSQVINSALLFLSFIPQSYLPFVGHLAYFCDFHFCSLFPEQSSPPPSLSSSTQDLLRAPWVVPISFGPFFSCRSSQMQERDW